MHQKQPPAKIAVCVVPAEELCAATCVIVRANAMQLRVKRKTRFILSRLDILRKGVVNKSDRFCLPSTGETVISGFSFSLSVTNNDQSRRDSLQYHFPVVSELHNLCCQKRRFDFSSACLQVRIA